jgi:bifunctional polynucleotide phosphatase/kinase
VRSKWIALARKHQVPIRCVIFLAEADLCEHNDVVRALNHAVSTFFIMLSFHLVGYHCVVSYEELTTGLQMNPEGRTRLPGIAFASFKSRYRRPELPEGFQDITEVKFQVRVFPRNVVRLTKNPIVSRD